MKNISCFPFYFTIAFLVDVVFQKAQGLSLMLLLHATLFIGTQRLPIFLILTFGLIEDVFFHNLLGTTSLFFLFTMVFFEKIKTKLMILDNFWLIWGSFIFLIMGYRWYLLTINHRFFLSPSWLSFREIIPHLLVISAYPLFFIMLKRIQKHVSS